MAFSYLSEPGHGGRGERQWVELATDLLRSLVRLRTVNPPGREEEAALVLARFAERTSLRCRIVPVAPGRAHAILDLPGLNPNLDPVVAVAHLDVVPAGQGWTRPPFEAALEEGYVWGRGAIDAKGVAAVWATILARRAATGPLPRTIRLIAAAGEEHPTGALGATLDAEPDLARARVAFGEGGGYIRGYEGKWYTAVGVAECGRAHLPPNPPGRSPLLVPPRPPSQLRAYLQALAEDLPDRQRALSELVEIFPADADARQEAFAKWTERVARAFGIQAAAVAAMTAAQPLPTPRRPGAPRGQYAVPPGAAPPTGARWAWPPSESVIDFPAYRAITATLAGEILPGLGSTRPLPVLTRGRTDLAWFRARGVASYGFLPLDSTDRPESVHGPDERISISAIGRSLRVLEAIAVQIAADPSPDLASGGESGRHDNTWEATK
jgi:hypothetical protein